MRRAATLPLLAAVTDDEGFGFAGACVFFTAAFDFAGDEDVEANFELLLADAAAAVLAFTFSSLRPADADAAAADLVVLFSAAASALVLLREAATMKE